MHSCTYHIVFCPKYRRRVLEDGVEERLRELAPEALEEGLPGSRMVGMEVEPDCVYLSVALPPQYSPHTAVKRVKAATSRALRAEFPQLRSRIQTLWTNSYLCTAGEPPEPGDVERFVSLQKTSQRDAREGMMG